MKWLLKLYPPAWRRRYEAEMAALLDESRGGRRSILDLLRGAADAWAIGPRGPLGGLEVWIAMAAYVVATIALLLVPRVLGLSGMWWEAMFYALYWIAFSVFINWLAHQPAARCDLGFLSRLRR